MSKYDVIVIGAGPVGLACAIEAGRRKLRTLVIEKGALVESLTRYPTGMEFFSTPDLLELGGHPFSTQRYKPTREEALDYYRRVAESEHLNLRLYETVQTTTGVEGSFRLRTDKDEYLARWIVVATGFFDQPNLMNVPGECLEKVTHYFREPYAYAQQRVAIVGAKNSAAKAALSCYRNGSDVTMIVRGDDIGQSVKYWIRPDLMNRIAEGAIKVYFRADVVSISDDAIVIETPDGTVTVSNDWVLALTGYHPNYAFLSEIGVDHSRDPANVPIHDSETFESNRRGIFLAGTVCGGRNTSRWFIENGRDHARIIMNHLSVRSEVQ